MTLLVLVIIDHLGSTIRETTDQLDGADGGPRAIV